MDQDPAKQLDMIRPYTLSDRQALLNLLQQNIPQFFAPEEATDYAEYLDHHREDYFVVEENGVLIGAGGINYFPDSRSARISWDIIHPNVHGKGIGRQLTQHRIDLLRNNPEVDEIIVRTSQLAYRFYEKMGFRLETIEKDYWAPEFDLYVMKMGN